MSKTAHILAVRASHLPLEVKASGFHPMPHEEALIALSDAGTFIGPRPLLEEDERFRQVIPYVILAKASDEFGLRFATYTRGASGNEARLHGKLSIGLGGHIDLPDIFHEQDGSVGLSYTLNKAAFRELDEEVHIRAGGRGLTASTANRVAWRGLLVDNADAVGRVHVGIVGVAVLDIETEVVPLEESQEDIQWLTADQLEANRDRLEGWTATLLPHLNQLLSK